MADCCYKSIIKYLLLITFFGSVHKGFSQEICNNGIDDDADGLVDLRDSVDCPCADSRSVFVPSLIRNPSFEEYTTCPGSHSELFVANFWQEATAGTTDYLNTCGFTYRAGPAGLLPFPDGQAAVGAFISGTYKEYVGTCLSTPLVAGRRYRLTMHIASSAVSPTPTDNCPQNIDNLFAPLNITIFGASSCNDLPVSTFYCPLDGNTAWKSMGDTVYTPRQSWSQITINFIPTRTTRTIMIGSPCVLPESYSDSLSGDCKPYFYFDNLILNEEKFFEDKIKLMADRCLSPPTFTSAINYPISPEARLQWYRNGAAVVGQRDSSFLFKTLADSAFYQLQVSDSARCLVSYPLKADFISPISVGFYGITDSILVKGAVLNLKDNNSEERKRTWLDCNGSFSNGEQVSYTLSDTGKCCYSLIVQRGACFDTASQCISVIDRPEILIPNLITPNGDGKNDVFEIKGSGLKAFSGSIYNRWGKKIYHWNGPVGYWKGSEGGNMAPDGVYFYEIDYTDLENKKISAKGWVTLNRAE